MIIIDWEWEYLGKQIWYIYGIAFFVSLQTAQNELMELSQRSIASKTGRNRNDLPRIKLVKDKKKKLVNAKMWFGRSKCQKQRTSDDQTDKRQEKKTGKCQNVAS